MIVVVQMLLSLSAIMSIITRSPHSSWQVLSPETQRPCRSEERNYPMHGLISLVVGIGYCATLRACLGSRIPWFSTLGSKQLVKDGFSYDSALNLLLCRYVRAWAQAAAVAVVVHACMVPCSGSGGEVPSCICVR